MALKAAVAAAGTWLTTGFTGAVVSGALIGAAIGGISAAITGGDIGKGVLFGAVGGAVTGAISYGIGSVLNGMGTGAEATSVLQEATGSSMSGGVQQQLAEQGLVKGTISSTSEAGKIAAGKVASDAAGKSFWGNLFEGETGVEFGKEAAGAAVGGLFDAYGQAKATEAAAKQGALQRAHERGMQDAQIASAERIASMKSGGGGGGSGPDYTIDELIARDTSAAEQERKTVLEKVSAEVEGQQALKQQEFDQAGALREMMAAGAGALKSGRTAGSRSVNTLVDLQDRIREGEGPAGDPNTGVIPPVTYVPPEEYA